MNAWAVEWSRDCALWHVSQVCRTEREADYLARGNRERQEAAYRAGMITAPLVWRARPAADDEARGWF